MATPSSTTGKKGSHRQVVRRCGPTRPPLSSPTEDTNLDPTPTTRAGRRRLARHRPADRSSYPSTYAGRADRPDPTSHAVSVCGVARSEMAVAKTRDGQAREPPGFGSNPTVGDPVRTRPRPVTHCTPADGGGDPVRSPPARAKPPGAYPPAGRPSGVVKWPVGTGGGASQGGRSSAKDF